MTEMFPMLDGVILLSNILLFVLGLIVLAVLVLFVIDITQTKDAVRRNYPVIGRFRYLFQTLGEFFRQYFFAMDREEMPFNRAERDWIHKSAHGEDNTSAFGSTRSLTPPGTAIFVNAPYPVMDEHDTMAPAVIIGEGTPNPYAARSLINISAMSYGSISRPAILALSRGAKQAGCWLNTGEGGLSPFHLEGGCDVVFQIGTAKYGVRTKDGALDETKLREVAAHPNIGELRGVGYMWALEAVRDRDGKVPFEGHLSVSERIANTCTDHGLICRPLGQSVVLCPAFTLSDGQMDEMCEKLDAALMQVFAEVA